MTVSAAALGGYRVGRDPKGSIMSVPFRATEVVTQAFDRYSFNCATTFIAAARSDALSAVTKI